MQYPRPGSCTTSTSQKDCSPEPFAYQWRSESAPFDLAVILVVLVLSIWGWASLRPKEEKDEEGDS